MKYKKYYDQYSKMLGDWILRFPAEETGKQRKLFKLWYGPLLTETGVTAVKVYKPCDP